VGLGLPSREDNRKLSVRVALIASGIIGATVLFLLFSCSPSFEISAAFCQASSNVQILVGVIIGTLTTAIFFLFIERGLSNIKDDYIEVKKEIYYLLEDYARAYVARTTLFNLKDVFMGKEYPRDNMIPDEVTRKKFLKRLNDDYLIRFKVDRGITKEVYDLAADHQPIEYHKPKLDTDHDYQNCSYCKDKRLIEKIEEAIQATRHPIL
jgi:hypothetical protein